MGFNLHSVWTDWALYLTAAAFTLALFLLVFSIRKYLEITNGPDLGGEDGEPEKDQGRPAPVEAEAEQAPAFPAPSAASPAEEFVKGLYDRFMNLDARVRNIETDLSSKINRDFTAKFLEDMITDFDYLDKDKIKSRIEYLLTDLKK